MTKSLTKYISLILLLLIALNHAFSQSDESKKLTQAKLKAVYIYNFTRYIEWPTKSKNNQFKIGMLGDDSYLFTELNKLSKFKKVGTDSINFVQCKDLTDLKDFNVLYVCDEYNEDLKKILKLLKGMNTLVITYGHKENENIMLNFVEVNNQLSFQLNTKNIKNFNLKVSLDLDEFAFLGKGDFTELISRLNSLEFENKHYKHLRKVINKTGLSLEKFLWLYLLLIISLIITGFILYSLRQKKKQAAALALQKEEISNRNKIIEEKNKEITDSMNYAKRIQASLMNSESVLKNEFVEFFIFYNPKDIVSGDFYWSCKEGDLLFTIVADCTGHGVPGAFMSLLCMSLLNESIHNAGLTSPDLVLNEVRKKLIEILNPAGIDSERKDGMDCALLVYNQKESKLRFACANNPIWFFSDEIFTEYKADKMPVGKFDFERPFTSNEIPVKKGDKVYLFSDGYADQFGGEKGKKFKYSKLQKIISENKHLPYNEQKNILDSTIKIWMGDLEQVDDMLVVGICF